MGFNGDFMGLNASFIGIYTDVMGFKGDFIGFDDDFMGFFEAKSQKVNIFNGKSPAQCAGGFMEFKQQEMVNHGSLVMSPFFTSPNH